MSQHLLFLHIPKNGGMTVCSLLDRFYPRDRIFQIEVLDHTQLNVGEFLALSQEEKDSLFVLQGHMLFGLHSQFSGVAKYITFLRRPEERVVSFYYYVRNHMDHRLHRFVEGGKLSIYDFVTQVDDGDVNNCQIRWISGVDGTEDEMLEGALANIENHFSFVGVLERFDESLVVLQQLNDWSVPYYWKQNVTRRRPVQDVLDTRTIEAIRERNVGDEQLYEKMLVRLNGQLSSIEDWESKLKRLQRVNAWVQTPGLRRVARWVSGAW